MHGNKRLPRAQALAGVDMACADDARERSAHYRVVGLLPGLGKLRARRIAIGGGGIARRACLVELQSRNELPCSERLVARVVGRSLRGHRLGSTQLGTGG